MADLLRPNYRSDARTQVDLAGDLPVRSSNEIRRRITDAASGKNGSIAAVTFIADIWDTATVTVPSGVTLAISGGGFTTNIPFACESGGFLEVSELALQSAFSGAGSAAFVDCAFAATAAIGDLVDCRFTGCSFGTTLTTGTLTASIISGCTIGSSDGYLAIGTLYDCSIDMVGGINSASPSDCIITISGDWAQTSLLGTGSNIIARNIPLSSGSGSGITQLTGDVTAGPGSGSVVATITNDSVTFAKMQNVATDVLLGRDSSGTGDIETLTLGGGLDFTGGPGIQRSALTGDVTASGGSNTTTIAANAVTNTKLADMPASTIKGNNTGSLADPIDLTAAQTKTLLAITASDVSGLAAIATSGSAADLTTGTIPDARMPDLTGDVTTSVGTVATTITANAVTDTKLRDSIALSVIGRSVNSTGDPADISASTDGYVLRRSGTTLGFGTIASTSVTGLAAIATSGSATDLIAGTIPAARMPALTGDVTMTAGTTTTAIAAGVIVNADVNASAAIDLSKLQTITTDRLLGRDTAGTGAIEQLTVGGGVEFTGTGIQRSALTGDITASAGSNTTAIAAGVIVNADVNASAAIDFSKLQTMTTDRILGRDTAGTGAVEQLTVSGGLEFTGTGIQRSALTGDVTASAGSNATTIAANAVTNTKLNDMPANTLKGNNTGGSADPLDLTVAQVNALLGTATGPGSSTDNALARFDGTTGKIIQNSPVTLDDTGLMQFDAGITGQIAAEDLSVYSTVTGVYLGAPADNDVTIAAGGLFGTLGEITLQAEAGVAVVNAGNPSGGGWRFDTATGPRPLYSYQTSANIPPTWSQHPYIIANGGGSALDGINEPIYSFSTDSDTGIGWPNAGGSIALISDGYTVATVSGTGIKLDGSLALDEVATPSTTVGYGKVYVDTNNYLQYLDETGVSTRLDVFRDRAALSVLGRDTNTIGTPVDIVAGTDGYVLQRSGNTLVFGPVPAAPGSGGDVVGPASSTDNAIARFNGTTGKLIQNSATTMTDDGYIYAPNTGSGGASAPVYSFAGDTNTGIYSSAADTVAIGAAGNLVWQASSGFVTRQVQELGNFGSAGNPSYSFNADNDTGIYRAASDTIGLSTGGTIRVSLGTTALETTLPVRGASGSETAPTYSFGSATNTGMYYDTSVLAFSTAGVGRVAIDNSVMYSSGTDTFSILHTGTPSASAPVYSFTGASTSGMFRDSVNGTVNITSTGTTVMGFGSTAMTSLVAGGPWVARVAGTVTAPTYAFNGDANTGMWSPAADTISLATAGTEAVRITSAGQVGINQASPSAMLDIVGDSAAIGLKIQSTAAQWMTIGGSTAASNYMTMFRPASGSALGYIGGGGGGAISAGTSNDLTFRSEGEIYLASGGNNPRLTLSSTGSQLAWSSNFTSTSDATITMDASIYQFGRWIASFTAGRTLQVSNLTDGRWIMCYIRNTNATARLITFNASTTAAGYATVNMSREGAASVTSISHAGTSGTSTVWIMNIGGTFVGSIS